MAATSIVRSLITEDGEKLQIIFSYPGNKIIDAQTTISFVSGDDELTLTINDSANGLSGFSIGDQIEITGSINASNNFFWNVLSVSASSMDVRVRHNALQEDTSHDRDGVTETAGSPISISVLPVEIDVTYGSISLSGDVNTVATIETAGVRNDNHNVYVYCNCDIVAPVTWGQSVLLTANTDAAWVMRNGQGNTAISSVNCVNRSQRKVSANPIGYDNWKFNDGVTDAPHGIGAAIDPSGVATLIDWWDPDVEVGYNDGDPIYEMTGVANGLLLETRFGVSNPQTYKVNQHNGKNFTLGEGRDHTWTSLALGNYQAEDRTIIVVRRMGSNSGVTSSSNNIFWNEEIVFSPTGYNYDYSTGVTVHIYRVDTSGNVTRSVNYTHASKTTTNVDEIRLNGSISAVPLDSLNGAIYAYSSILTDDQCDRMTRWILNEYAAAWAPTFYVSSSGVDSNSGTKDSPFASMQEAMNRCGTYTSPHIVLQENDILYTGLPGGGSTSTSGFSSVKGEYGRNEFNPVVVRVEKVSSTEPVATLMNVGTFDTYGSGARHKTDWITCGLVRRQGEKIPASSPLRIAEDDAFNISTTSSTRLISFVPVSSTMTDFYGDQTLIHEHNMCLINCHNIGGGLANIQASVLDPAHSMHYSMIDCSTSHDWGDGHTVSHFVSSRCFVYEKNIIMITPGHEPMESIEPADIFSRGIYDQFGGPGCHIIDGLLTVYDASSPIQMRSGGWVNRTSIIDGSSGWSGTFCDAKFSNIIQEGGHRDASSQAINWGGGGSNMVVARFDKILFLPERTYNSNSYGLGFNNNPSLISDNGTIGNGPGNQWSTLGEDWRRVEVTNMTWADRSETAIDLSTCKNVTIDNMLARTAYDVVDVRVGNEAYVTAGNYTFTNNIIDQSSGDMAKVEGVSKTLSEFEAIVSTSSSNVESTITFADDTRSFQSYARTYLDDVAAEVEDLAYEIVRQRVGGQYDATIQYDYIFDWVRNGYYSTSNPGLGAVSSQVDQSVQPDPDPDPDPSGGYSGPQADPAWLPDSILSSIVAEKIVPPTGNWVDFNAHHRAWVKMNRLAKIRYFFMDEDDIPSEPNPDDYSNLG